MKIYESTTLFKYWSSLGSPWLGYRIELKVKDNEMSWRKKWLNEDGRLYPEKWRKSLCKHTHEHLLKIGYEVKFDSSIDLSRVL